WVVKEADGDQTVWRLYCQTDKQDGTQGAKIPAKSKKFYEFYHNEGEKWMPEGYYLDLTAILQSHDFDRIPAQDGWESHAKKQEWWHFYYATDVQETFSDEMELIGFTEQKLRQWGWSQSDLDHRPG